MVHYPKWPTSIWAGIAPFVLAGLILVSATTAKLWPNPVIMYTVLGLVTLIIIGAVGWNEIIERLGFDITQPGERFEQVWWRYPLMIGLGLAIGYGVFRLLALMTMTLKMPFILFPMDFALATWMLPIPFFFTAINWLIVATGEELFRNSTIFTFANWLGKTFGWTKDSAVSGGILFSAVLFIALHTIVNPEYTHPLAFIIMTCIAFLFSALGYFLSTRAIFGRWAFLEFCILAPISAHFAWNLLMDMELRVMGPLLAVILGLV